MKQIFAILLFTVSLAALAHGDDDHGAAPLVVSQSVAPRASAATEEFEVVALLDGKKLLVYLDRFASNEPVQKALVEVEGAGVKGVATESTLGLYAINLPAVPTGRHALTISIEAGEVADLLSVSLDTSAPAGNSASPHGGSKKLVWSIAGLLTLAAAGLALLLVRRRKQIKVR